MKPTYRDLMDAREALRTLGKVRKTRVAMATRRIINAVNEELQELRKLADDHAAALADEDRRDGAIAAMERLLDEPADGLRFDPVPWGDLPDDCLSAFELDSLIRIGALKGVPE